MQIELDDQKVQGLVVAALVQHMLYDAKELIKRELELEIRNVIRAEARAHLQELIRDFKMPDGRTLKEYVTDLFVKTTEPKHATSWNARPRLYDVVDNVLQEYSRDFFKEKIKERLDDSKEELTELIVKRMLEHLRK